MAGPERIDYDEFGLFHENAAEYGLPFDEPPTVRREQVDVGGGRRLSALVWGEGHPEIVLLHGGAQNAHTWDTVALALRPRPLLAIDLPGHGHSDGPSVVRGRRHSPGAAADDVAVVVRALAPTAVGVVGMSFGGLTAIALADRAPDLVRRLLLVDVLPGLDAAHAQHISDFVNGPPTFASFDELLERTKQFNPTRRESSLRRGILHNALQLDDGSWVWRHSRWRLDERQPAPAGGADPADATDAAPDDAGHAALVDALGRIDVPVLLARGMRPDSVLRDDDEARLRRLQPNARVVHFERAGHSIQGDMPLELAATIAEFLP
ncbi:MAG TPA: alpha/beta hydrolase [Acidimicrobiales bacterium]|nr:alpha/beta hydrolase [Acidimicrobiales bacterium]